MRIARATAAVRVPATSGNLGPGFDSMGMAHNLWDEVHVRLVTGPTRVTVTGEGAGRLPTDDSHLVVRALRHGLDAAGLPQSGIELTCHNEIRQGRGLGSSAAAVVAGLMLIRGLVDRPEEFDDAALLALATEFEGHPDNAAPAIHGGAVVSWVSEADGSAHVVQLALSPRLKTTLLIPEAVLATKKARSVLPSTVPHADAAHNAARSAMLVVALERSTELLLEATDDRLHQAYRAASMPESFEVLTALREAGWPAVISGAGPSILVFDEIDAQTGDMLADRGFTAFHGGVARGAHLIEA
ncbi:MAG: homoserine kinase [Actinomycetaceae bacterium]|nr:homoserine kinase [Actinomycetaceae bacterium]